MREENVRGDHKEGRGRDGMREMAKNEVMD